MMAWSYSLDFEQIYSSMMIKDFEMQFKFTTTIKAAGQLAKFYVVIRGLSVKELPVNENDDGLFTKKIPGFELSWGFDWSSQTERYIAVIPFDPTHEESENVRNFKYHNEN
eukprot:4017451-Ditylum_brightwellii.AAC.1